MALKYLVSWFHGHRDENPPPYSTLSAKPFSRKEEKRVRDLRSLLRHLYTSDYLIPTSLPVSESKTGCNNLYWTAFRVPWKLPKVRHWYHIHDLIVAPMLQRQPGTHLPSAEQQAQTEQFLLEHVDRPAEVLGLDPEVVRRRLEHLKPYASISPLSRAHGYWSSSEVIEMAGQRRFQELAQKMIHDRELTLRLLFAGMMVKEKETGFEVSLYEVLLASLDDMQDRVFLYLRAEDHYILLPLVEKKLPPRSAADRSGKITPIGELRTPKAAKSNKYHSERDTESRGTLGFNTSSNPRPYRRDILRRDLGI